MDKWYPISEINENLKKYNVIIRQAKDKGPNNYRLITPRTQENILGKGGDVCETVVKDVEKIVSKELGRPVSLIEKPSLDRITGFILIIFSAGLLFLVSVRTNLFTGYAINNISNTNSNIGIVICVLGILGLLFYRIRKK